MQQMVTNLRATQQLGEEITRMHFVDPQEACRSYKRAAYRLRFLNPRGHYLGGNISSQDCLYSANTNIAFTVVRCQPFDQLDSDFPHSEMDWAAPDELRFWASILLCEVQFGPQLSLYPSSQFYVLDAVWLDLSSPESLAQISTLVEELFNEATPFWGADVKAYRTDEYSLFYADYSVERQPAFWSAIDLNNHCLLRGMACLIKAGMLASHREFCEEAGLVMFIALDASHSLVLDVLKQEGIKSPTTHDAGDWVDRTFNETLGQPTEPWRYFEQDYEKRIMSFHPRSRFGDALYAPFINDDWIHLRSNLLQIFAYLVLRSDSPEKSKSATARLI